MSRPIHIESTPAGSTNADNPPLRFVTAAALFDGHDAAINVMRRLIQAQGAEVVHLGHNRSVADIVRAALQENADAIAVSSYQGGHSEFFRYMVDMLRERGAGHIRIFGGGGGTITPEEIQELTAYGVEYIYHPNDGAKMGLVGMITDLMARARTGRVPTVTPKTVDIADELTVGQMLSAIEDQTFPASDLARLRKTWSLAGAKTPVLGFTGTGGAGKSSVVDELVQRFLAYFPEMRIAVLAVDPTRRRSGGALLGDRIRMNSLRSERVFMRSLATRRQNAATSAVLSDCISFLKAQGYDLVIVETAGIGQADTEVVDLVDFPVYVMTSDYGAPTQLEKIDMIDFADVVVLNKYDRRGAQDALRDVRKQWRRNHVEFALGDEDVPVYATIASQFNDPGINWLFDNLCRLMRAKLGLPEQLWTPGIDTTIREPRDTVLIPANKVRYLAEISDQGRKINGSIHAERDTASRAEACWRSLGELGDPKLVGALERYPADDLADDSSPFALLRRRYNELLGKLTPASVELLQRWPATRQGVTDAEYSYQVRGRELTGSNYVESLSRLQIPKVAAPSIDSWGELLRFLQMENLPGHYPYTAGIYPYRRDGEEPTRMFAGEGAPERTNRRFHYLSSGQKSTRLSTAFDSVTLYGEDPAERPDIYGKIGNSGVSIATLDDMKKLYSGFNLCDPTTSVSMTINGPAPIVLAMFMNTAVDQQVEKYLRADPERWANVQGVIDDMYRDGQRPRYDGSLPPEHDGLGLGLLGVSGDEVIDRETYEKIANEAMRTVRGTVQADIFKEDQAQNTCIFSTEFALRMMGDVQETFVRRAVRNFYSVSISGYHIAEAGANPISQLAFTLSNGFTIVEYYLARGMKIDEFAPNLSFFFSNGMDPEYSVIGRVARRIWARAMRERYGANSRSQMMKYHIQTSGRSLHAQEIQFNDIRTTLQALYALLDNCNSLHTNAYDEAITTPTEESVRRAVAIQLIINRELGINYCENPWQGSFAIERLTDMVEEAVYLEFDAISERGGVLGAMDTMYQRGKIQEESLYYEHKKFDGSLPLIGVNTFLPKDHGGEITTTIELIRSTEAEKRAQIDNVRSFSAARNLRGYAALSDLRETARKRQNVFDSLLSAVKYHSLGQISHALYEVGGEYRRNM